MAMRMKLKTTTVFVALTSGALTILLTTFQNCGPSFQPYQTVKPDEISDSSDSSSIGSSSESSSGSSSSREDEPSSTPPPLNADASESYAWMSSEWAACSAICGGGVQVRNVECRSSHGILAEES